MIRVLSIDGGGVLGIIPAMVLEAMESKIRAKTGNSDARIIEYLDFLAGTSTGGIILSLLNCPISETDSRPKFSATDIVTFYKEEGPKIFRTSWWKRTFSSVGLSDVKYEAAYLEGILEKNFGDLWLSQMLKPCLIPAYNLELGKTHFFCHHDHQNGKNPYKDFRVKDLCRATSAAPSYFEPALVSTASNVKFPFLDGGVFANNPSMCAIAEITKADGKFSPQDMLMISFGTGRVAKNYDFNRFRRSIALAIIPDIINIMMTGVSETTDYTVRSLFESLDVGDNYVRFDPMLADAKMAALDNASPKNIERLMAITSDMISERESEIDNLVARLLAETAKPFGRKQADAAQSRSVMANPMQKELKFSRKNP